MQKTHSSIFEKNLRNFYLNHATTIPCKYQSSVNLLALLEHPRVTHRDHKVHLTSSSIVFHPNGQDILLLLHKKYQFWVYPGGHVDGTWDLLGTAGQECLEETGIGEFTIIPPFHDNTDKLELLPHFFKVVAVPEIGKEKAHTHIDSSFVFRSQTEKFLANERETQGMKWVSIDQINHLKNQQCPKMDGFPFAPDPDFFDTLVQAHRITNAILPNKTLLTVSQSLALLPE